MFSCNECSRVCKNRLLSVNRILTILYSGDMGLIQRAPITSLAGVDTGFWVFLGGGGGEGGTPKFMLQCSDAQMLRCSEIDSEAFRHFFNLVTYCCCCYVLLLKFGCENSWGGGGGYPRSSPPPPPWLVWGLCTLAHIVHPMRSKTVQCFEPHALHAVCVQRVYSPLTV